jgi:DNA-binding CsgD family transcriptional regulator
VQVSGTNDQLIPSPPCGASSLTPRQTEVLQLAARGLSRKKIARLLGISVRTVEDHFSAMRQRAGAHSESELIAYAVMAGLVTSGDAAAVRWPRARPQPASEPLCVTPASATTSETSGHMRGVHFSRVGLARITVDAHNAQLEYDALTEAGCGRIFKEQTNAGKMDCPGVAAALDHLRQGDIFVVWKAPQSRPFSQGSTEYRPRHPPAWRQRGDPHRHIGRHLHARRRGQILLHDGCRLSGARARHHL